MTTPMSEGCWVCNTPTFQETSKSIRIGDFLAELHIVTLGVHVCPDCASDIRQRIAEMRAYHWQNGHFDEE